MKKRLFIILPAIALALTSVLGVSAAQGAESEVPMETYQLSDGSNYFLVPLQADAIDTTADYVDVVALIDFSASQLAKETRETTQETVANMVANLPKNARVQLFAVSNETEPITDGFLAVDSPELKAAVAKLGKHDALGAADLEKSFSVAMNAFDYNDAADRSIVFVGRGVSTGAAFDEKVFEETVEKLVDARVPVNSFGVGSNVNLAMLGALANRTGGYVVDAESAAKDAGVELAKAATATVFYPESDELAIAGAKVYPSPLPPIRSDRETYLIGVSQTALRNADVSIPVALADGREADIEWSLAPQASSKANQYLYQLAQSAVANNGATLPIAGSSLLADQQVAINDAIDLTLDLADQAQTQGDTTTASRLAGMVQDQVNDENERGFDAGADDDDVAFDEEDETVLDETDASTALDEDEAFVADEDADLATDEDGAFVADEDADLATDEDEAFVADEVETTAAATPQVNDELFDESGVDEDDFEASYNVAARKVADKNRANQLEAAASNVKVASEQLKAHVRVVTEQARKNSKSDPEGELQHIKFAIESVKKDPVISADLRATLLSELAATGEFVRAAKAQRDVEMRRAMVNQATIDAVRKAHDVREANETKVVEIMKRFKALIEESKYILAAEAAYEASKIAPNNALPTQAYNVAILADAWHENQYLRHVRQKKLLDTLMSVERAHVPVSDEPPISYPDPEVWVNLTKVRKAKYGQANLTGSEEEQRIAEALEIKVDVDGGEESGLMLSDWIEQVKQTLRDQGQAINIVFDTTNIEEAAGAPSSLDVNEQLSNITLRKALKLVLRPHDLGFTIIDDALFITTQDEIKNNPEISTTLQFYSVGDLIMRPNSGGMMGGMGGMGMGGMGGMMGGMGMMGGRGGMMGGMGGMGGRGMFNVPSTGRANNAAAGAANDAIMKNFLDQPAAPAAGDAGLFAVPSKSNKQTAATVAPKAAGSLAQAPVDLDAKYDAWFAAKAVKALPEGATQEQVAAYEKNRKKLNDEIILETQRLIEEQPEAAAAFLKAAMRNDCASSWMYEALVAALIKAKAPQKEIEKAALSVADFSGDPLTLLGIAAYLESIGSDARALKIYRDVAKIEPSRPEPYVRGLALAKELNDEDALMWVAEGIASTVWDGILVEQVQEPGVELAEDLYEKMKSEGREKDAEAFAKRIADARVRDVLVEIRWSGDAEIDLAVQEPTSAVCWYAQNRTASGGVLFDTTYDVRRGYADNLKDLRSKAYVCPMGFSGDYNFLITKSWGDLAQNKVTVSIITNAGTPNQHQLQKVVELKDDEAGFVVSLVEGRRKEEVKEEILNAAAMMQQLQVRTSRELARLAKAAESSSAHNEGRASSAAQSKASEYVSSYKSSTEKKSDESDVPQITYVEPTPGYYPVIDYISTGAGFSTSAGISGDRRYVLVAPTPYFSQLLKMFAYNSQDGGSYGSSGGYGGGGMGGYGGGMSGGYGGGMGGYGGGMGGMGGYGGGMGGMGGMMGGRGGMSY